MRKNTMATSFEKHNGYLFIVSYLFESTSNIERKLRDQIQKINTYSKMKD